ncbi:hypothetical protein T10_3823 [Trichinella papuae]|uniref:Uncharacterized protein n=1 Tax=Trichinella papuae TaxID=268474 RepID=A0A0V1MY30_9BILA|nr:hypothetical protein T10_3823 [Trichinella papuae]
MHTIETKPEDVAINDQTCAAYVHATGASRREVKSKPLLTWASFDLEQLIKTAVRPSTTVNKRMSHTSKHWSIDRTACDIWSNGRRSLSNDDNDDDDYDSIAKNIDFRRIFTNFNFEIMSVLVAPCNTECRQRLYIPSVICLPSFFQTEEGARDDRLHLRD